MLESFLQFTVRKLGKTQNEDTLKSSYLSRESELSKENLILKNTIQEKDKKHDLKTVLEKFNVKLRETTSDHYNPCF